MRRALAASCCVALASASLCAARAASAKEPVNSKASEESDEVALLVERGIELRRSGQDAQALLVFEAALEKAPRSARVRVHIATTHQALGQWLEADRYLRILANETDDPYVRRHRLALDKAREVIDLHLGSLDVTGEPAGAEIWLSGQAMGTLPLAEPLRATVGAYVLEVKSQGHYPVSRPITITSRGFLRESVFLARRDPPVSASTPSDASPFTEHVDASPRWLTWTLTGVGTAAALSSGIALWIRERHADRWNGRDCLAADLTRGQVCSDELDAGQSAETVAITTGVVATVFLGGALASYWLEAPSDEEVGAGVACGLGWASVGCRGAF